MTRLIHATFTAALMLACGAAQDCSAIHSDGSSACGEPVWASDLVGTWAEGRISLTVDYSGRYTWTVGGCTEHGQTSGAVEFLPDATSDFCYATGPAGLYSASVDWAVNGIAVYLDGVDYTIRLKYQP